MCLIRQTRFYCNHTEVHKINYCNSSPSSRSSSTSSHSSSSSTTSSTTSPFFFGKSKNKAKKSNNEEASTATTSDETLVNLPAPLLRGTQCLNAKWSVCRTENRSCVICKLGRSACMGNLSLAGVRVIIKADAERALAPPAY